MKTRIALTLAGTGLVIIALAGCAGGSSAGGGGGYGSSSSSSSAPAPAPAKASTDLSVGTSGTLGKVIVDGKGFTAYVFDKDTAGATSSACSDKCAALWPAITSTSTTPTITGVTGKVGTIKGVAGGNQVTINGLPIYTFSGDKAKGDTAGQGLMGIWWAISPSGQKITTVGTGY